MQQTVIKLRILSLKSMDGLNRVVIIHIVKPSNYKEK